MKIFKGLALSALFATSAATLAEDPAALSKEEINAQMRGLQLPVVQVRDSGMPGFYEVLLDGNQSLYISDDGRYFLTGDLYRMNEGGPGFVNLTETKRTERRKALINAVPESEMVVFSPPQENVKATISVFTDVDCGYCRKLHQEVPELNRMGIAVRYLAYPRAGTESRSYDKIVSAWCADNPQEALTLAKLGQEIEEATCENPVASHFRLGNEVGVTGTPSLVVGETGRMIPGYMPAEKLARELGVIN